MKKTKARRAAAALLALVLFAPALTGCRKEPASADPNDTPEYGAEQTYAETLFDSSRVHEINVEITNEDREDLRANPTAKTKYRTNVTIDGEKVEEVSFSTKGNTSLSSVALDKDSDRYSFKLNFGKYEKGQTYRGLNKLNLNNLYADATYMKDFISYELFREVGIDAPLVSYVWLKVNGEALGLYIAIEDVSESWLDRMNNGEGELYKPESEMLDNIGHAGQPGSQPGGTPGASSQPGGSGQPGWNPGGMPGQPGQPGQPGGMPGLNPGGSESPGSSEMPTPPEGWSGQNPPEGWSGQTPPEGWSGSMPGEVPGEMPGNMPGSMPGNMPGGFGDGSGGASLVYSDDEISSYPDIFENGVTDPDEDSQARVIAALKALSEGDYDSAVDGAETAKYFAAHNFVLNYDSYTGTMLHNYYLYENNGRLSMFPWDYNESFGAFSRGSSNDAA
ncbi:MAG: CotH kinase family protein, partial [Clostridia bacterium]|nr:CotH kinase family protein [Clostridia bacterium]